MGEGQGESKRRENGRHVAYLTHPKAYTGTVLEGGPSEPFGATIQQLIFEDIKLLP